MGSLKTHSRTRWPEAGQTAARPRIPTRSRRETPCADADADTEAEEPGAAGDPGNREADAVPSSGTSARRKGSDQGVPEEAVAEQDAAAPGRLPGSEKDDVAGRAPLKTRAPRGREGRLSNGRRRRFKSAGPGVQRALVSKARAWHQPGSWRAWMPNARTRGEAGTERVEARTNAPCPRAGALSEAGSGREAQRVFQVGTDAPRDH